MKPAEAEIRAGIEPLGCCVVVEIIDASNIQNSSGGVDISYNITLAKDVHILRFVACRIHQPAELIGQAERLVIAYL